ncbi:MAG: hypothetical protein RJA70_5 [Pseudomonadota bacterium]
MLRRAQVLKGRLDAKPAGSPAGASARGAARVILRSEADAHAASEMIRSRALALAEESRQQAESGAQKVRNQARDEGYASGLADAAARVLFLAQLEADADARQLERTVGLARLLAERLLGKALELDASVAASLAQQALAEVRGASRVTLFVSPADQQTIARSLDAPSYTQAAVELRTDDALASGHFRLQTNIGTLDAALGSRLALLGDKLREGLKK